MKYVLPDDFDYEVLPGLSNELKQKLAQHKPRNLAQAMKVDGVTPAAISLILSWLRRQVRQAQRVGG